MNKDEVSAGRLRADAGWLAAAAIAGIVTFVGLVAVLHFVDPDRDPISITVSEYVLGPHGWLLTFAASAFGLGVLALTAAIAAILPSSRPRVGLTLLGVAGLGMVVVGAFPTDPVDPTHPRFVTTAGSIHAVAGILAFTCIAVAAPLLNRRIMEATDATALRGLALVPPVGYAVFWLTGILDHQLGGLFGSRSATGLGERIMAAAFIVWLMAAAFSVRRAVRHGSRTGAPDATA